MTPPVHQYNPAAYILFMIAKYLPGGWWSILGCFFLGFGIVAYLVYREPIHEFVKKYVRPVVDNM